MAKLKNRQLNYYGDIIIMDPKRIVRKVRNRKRKERYVEENEDIGLRPSKMEEVGKGGKNGL